MRTIGQKGLRLSVTAGDRLKFHGERMRRRRHNQDRCHPEWEDTTGRWLIETEENIYGHGLGPEGKRLYEGGCPVEGGMWL